MADDFTLLNKATVPGGDNMDETATTYSTPPLLRKKPRVVIAGSEPDGADVVQPIPQSPIGAEYAVPTRNMPATPTTSSLTGTPIDAAAAGDNIVIAAGAGTTRVFRLFLVCSAAVQLQFKSGVTALTAAMQMSAGGAITLDFDSEPWFETAGGEDFIINLSAAVQVSGRVYYQQS